MFWKKRDAAKVGLEFQKAVEEQFGELQDALNQIEAAIAKDSIDDALAATSRAAELTKEVGNIVPIIERLAFLCLELKKRTPQLARILHDGQNYIDKKERELNLN